MFVGFLNIRHIRSVFLYIIVMPIIVTFIYLIYLISDSNLMLLIPFFEKNRDSLILFWMKENLMLSKVVYWAIFLARV